MKIAATKDNRALVIVEKHADNRAYDVTAALPTPVSPIAGPWFPLFESGEIDLFLESLNLDEFEPIEFTEADLAAPISRPGKIIAAPVNYIDHKIEMSEQKTIAEYGVFLKANTSVIGPTDIVEIPYLDKRTDQEGELAVIIGRGGRHISRDQALEHVFGYTAALDITVRSTEDRSTRKSYDTFTPLGPWIIRTDEISDPGNLSLQSHVDGELRQDTNTSELIFDVPQLISYASSVMTLCPGDVIVTGTPAGVGPISDGSPISVTIGQVGTLRVTASAENAIRYDERPGALVLSPKEG